jgi:aminopeptidase N
MQNKTIYRKDYQPFPFKVLSIDLSFDLYEDHTQVTSRMQFERSHAGNLHLNGDALQLISVHLDEQPIEPGAYQLDNGDLILTQCPDAFTLTTVVHIKPQQNTALSGLYRSNRLFCTQCEAEGFRRITFFPDRPDVLTTFTTRISADKNTYPLLLSNGDLIDSGEHENGRHWAVWHDPFKKPSYLFALVAGELACIKDSFITQSGRVIDLRIYVEQGNETRASHAMASLQKAMRWDEERFGREYDLNTYMIVAVSDFNMGAMENKGLNLFNSKYILVSPETATDQDYIEVESVIGHEYFHNWSGNRITCRDWFQLSLKEGLTVFREHEFAADMNVRDVNRITEVRALKSSQFPEDASAMAHPVRPESYQEINNFYTATIYNKGAEVIRMQHTILGQAGFRRGMDLYFERHDGQAVTIDDFVAAMEDANQVDLTQFKRWYSQAGTPEVVVQQAFQNGCLTLTLSQSCRPTAECKDKKPFHIPIQMALWSADGKRLQEALLELKEPETQFHFEGLQHQPVISLLRDFSAPIKLQQIQTETDLLTLLKYETNGFARWNAGQTLALKQITSWLNQSEETWVLSPKLIEAYCQVLNDESLEMALRADILTPPHFEDVAATLVSVDVGQVENVRNAYRNALGKALYPHAKRIYQILWAEEDGTTDCQSFGRRKLRNTCLWLMMKGDEAATLPFCTDLFQSAPTMTGKLASFILLANVSEPKVRQNAIDEFYAEWSDNDLVMDKWFSVQASSEAPDTPERVKALLSHPAFHMKNPNKVRAVIGAFAQFNPRYFHALDGSGYAFLTEMLLKLDTINPQVAARLASPFTRWQRFDAPRQMLMRQQLERLAGHSLSRDLHEVVEKCLNEH